MSQEFSELIRIHLPIFELMVMIMLWKILNRRDRGRLKQLKPFKQPYLKRRRREGTREKESISVEWKKER